MITAEQATALSMKSVIYVEIEKKIVKAAKKGKRKTKFPASEFSLDEEDIMSLEQEVMDLGYAFKCSVLEEDQQIQIIW